MFILKMKVYDPALDVIEMKIQVQANRKRLFLYKKLRTRLQKKADLMVKQLLELRRKIDGLDLIIEDTYVRNLDPDEVDYCSCGLH